MGRRIQNQASFACGSLGANLLRKIRHGSQGSPPSRRDVLPQPKQKPPRTGRRIQNLNLPRWGKLRVCGANLATARRARRRPEGTSCSNQNKSHRERGGRIQNQASFACGSLGANLLRKIRHGSQGSPPSRRDVLPLPKQKPPRLRWLLFWQGQEDSNPRPTVLETGTLPAELYPCMCLFLTHPILYHIFFAIAILF